MNASLRSIAVAAAQRACAAAWPNQRQGASVLLYHSVGRNPAFFTVPPDAFARQMAWLARSKKTVLPLGELVLRRERGEPLADCVALTFDDGYADNLEHALPVLRRHGFRASMFLIPGLMGTTYTTSDGVALPLFSWEEAQRARAGDAFEWLPHTDLHPELPALSESDGLGEIRRGHERLAALADAPVPKILAYPRGKVDGRTPGWLAGLGWQAACTVRPGLFTAATDRFLIPRNPVDSRTSFARFRFFLSDAVQRYADLCQAIS